MCCDSPTPPDNSWMRESNDKAVEYGKQVADSELAFRKKTYEDSKPMQKGLYDMAQKVADSQLTDAGTFRGRSSQQWDQYNKTFVPMEEKMASEAMAYGGAADQELQAAQAAGAIKSQAAQGREASKRSMASMGINPNSARFASLDKGLALKEAAATAAAMTGARTLARDKGIGLRAGAAAFGRNQVNTAGQMTGLASASGSSAVSNANTGAMSGLPYANFATGGSGTALQAAGMGINANLAYGNMVNNAYASQNADDGTGKLLGTVGGMAAKYFMSSSKKIKHDKAPIEGEAVLEAIDDVPVEKWTYNKGTGDEGTHVGPYAEDMQKKFGDDVAPEGKKIDLVSANGINLAAIKALKGRMENLEARFGLRG